MNSSLLPKLRGPRLWRNEERHLAVFCFVLCELLSNTNACAIDYALNLNYSDFLPYEKDRVSGGRRISMIASKSYTKRKHMNPTLYWFKWSSFGWYRKSNRLLFS